MTVIEPRKLVAAAEQTATDVAATMLAARDTAEISAAARNADQRPSAGRRPAIPSEARILHQDEMLSQARRPPAPARWVRARGNGARPTMVRLASCP